MDLLTDRSRMYFEGIGGIIIGGTALVMWLGELGGNRLRAVVLFIIAGILMYHSEILEARL